MDKGGITIRVKTSMVLVALMVLLGTVTAVSACDVNIDVKPDSWPNPLNLKDNGVDTVAVDGNSIENFYNWYYGPEGPDKTSADALSDFEIEGVYLQKKGADDPLTYVFDVNNLGAYYALEDDGTRLLLENVHIAPNGGDPIIYNPDEPDLLIKFKNLHYNGADLSEGEYYLAVLYQIKTTDDKYFTTSDIVRIMY